MTRYIYKAIDANGSFVSGELKAEGLDELEKKLAELHYVPLETKRARDFTLSTPFATNGVPKREITQFLKELALVLSAGIPLGEALVILAAEQRTVLARTIRSLNSKIMEGISFADALADIPDYFDAELIAIV